MLNREKFARWLCCSILLLLAMLAGCAKESTGLTGTLTGAVKDELTGYGIRYAKVTLGKKVVEANYAGKFVFRGCKIGAYVLKCSVSTHETRKVNVTILSGVNTLEIKMTPLPMQTLTIEALDNNDQPLTDHIVSISRGGANPRMLGTDQRGRCILDVVGGLYDIKVFNMDRGPDPERIIEFPREKKVTLYLWKFTEKNVFFDDCFDTLSTKTPTVSWPVFQIGKRVIYKIGVAKYSRGEHGKVYLLQEEQSYICAGDSVVLKPLSNGGVYKVNYSAYDAQTGQQIAEFESPYLTVDLKADNPATSEEWVNWLELLLNTIQDELNQDWDNCSQYADLLSDDYSDNLGRNKSTLLEYIQSQERRLLVSIQKVKPTLTGGTLKSATVKVNIVAVNILGGKRIPVELTFTNHNGKLQITHALFEK